MSIIVRCFILSSKFAKNRLSARTYREGAYRFNRAVESMGTAISYSAPPYSLAGLKGKGRRIKGKRRWGTRGKGGWGRANPLKYPAYGLQLFCDDIFSAWWNTVVNLEIFSGPALYYCMGTPANGISSYLLCLVSISTQRITLVCLAPGINRPKGWCPLLIQIVFWRPVDCKQQWASC